MMRHISTLKPDKLDIMTDSGQRMVGCTLKEDFFDRPTPMVACDLLGKVLVHNTSKGTLGGLIVETEAYLGLKDPACHVSGEITPRNKIFYGSDPGTVYVFLSFGIHHCMNLLTGGEHPTGCVLLRAAEPISGIPIMKTN